MKLMRSRGESQCSTCIGKIVSYSQTFKVAAVKSNKDCQTPIEIFIEAGINLDIIRSN